MVKLANHVSRFRDHKVLILGDLMLDTYTIGEVRRVSPEAPVCVLKVNSQDDRPGGAGNVALCIREMGSTPLLLGKIGQDIHGKRLKNVLDSRGVSPENLLVSEEFPTIVKNRLIGSGQQMLRVDFEEIAPMTEKELKNTKSQILSLLKDVHIVGISDYAKGYLPDELIFFVIQEAAKLEIKVIIDPKGMDFSKYKGAYLIKPNLLEAYHATGLPQTASIDLVGNKLLEMTHAEHIIITRSGKGMSLFSKGSERLDFKSQCKEVIDVTGAGDTVLSTLLVSLANDLSLEDALHLANISAGLAVEKFGCAQVSLGELTESLLIQNPMNKIFREQDLFPLKRALEGKSYYVLSADLGEGMEKLLKAARTLSQKEKGHLILYIRNGEANDESLELLASFHEIHYIILKADSLKHLCEEICPQALYLLKEGLLEVIDIKQVLESF